MKLLFLIDSLGSGGAQRQISNLALLALHEGYEVEVLTYYPDDFFADSLIEHGIKVNCINENNPIKRIIKIRKIIKVGDQEAVISFLDTPNFIACLSSIGKKKWTLIVSERSAKPEAFISKKALLMKQFYRYADYIITNSYNAKDMWIKSFPKYKNKIITIYNIINTNYDDVIEYTPKKEGKTSIIIPASYQSLKNMDGVIEAVRLLSDDEKKRLTINWYGRIETSINDTTGYDRASRKIANYNLENVIKLHPENKYIIKEMNKADFVGLFSYYEGLPNAICEGMSLGKPVVMSRVSDYSILVDDRNGYLCDPSNISSITKSIRSCLNTDIDELKAMGINSRIKASQLFNYKKIFGNFQEILNK